MKYIYVLFLIILLLFILSCIIFFHFKINYELNGDKTINPKNLYNHLKFVSTLFKKNNIKYWIMYGTLLGAVRNNDIIPSDIDFDVGTSIDNLNNILDLNDKIEVYGYKFVKPITYGYSFKDCNKRKNIWRVSLKVVYLGVDVGDIYFYQRCKDGYMRRMDYKTGIYFWPNSTFPASFIDNLEEIRIKNTYFPSPNNPDLLLKHWYGENWRTPIRSKSSGGIGDKDSDYYGGDKHIKLDFNIKPIIDFPINFVYPSNATKWIMENEIDKKNIKIK